MNHWPAIFCFYFIINVSHYEIIFSSSFAFGRAHAKKPFYAIHTFDCLNLCLLLKVNYEIQSYIHFFKALPIRLILVRW